MKRNGAGLASICILSTMGARYSVVYDMPVRPVGGCTVNKRYPKDGVSTDQLCRPDCPERGRYGAVYQFGWKIYWTNMGRTAENLEDYRMYSLSAYQSGAEFMIDLNSGELTEQDGSGYRTNTQYLCDPAGGL